MEKKKIRKVLKIFLIVILLVILLLLIHTIRNFMVIKKLQQNVEPYLSRTNYHIKSVATESSGIVVTMNYYQKDNKQVCFMERNNNGDITKISMYNNGERTDIFTETANSKTVKLNGNGIMSVQIFDYLQTDNSWQTFLASITAKIKKTEYNEKECYIINDFFSTMSLNGTDKNEVYLQKDTGLYVKSIIDTTSSEREYEFDNVDDSIFAEPDISQYTLKENE